MNRFALGIGWRVVGIVCWTGLLTAMFLQRASGLWIMLPAGLLAWQAANLYTYVTGLNRKLTQFLESIRYSDFTISFRTDSNLGPTFRELNTQFNEVMAAFQRARAENEASLHYINTIIQHVNVGLLTFDASEQIELVNQAALRLLGIYRLRTLGDLEAAHPELVRLLRDADTIATEHNRAAATSGSLLYQVNKGRMDGELSVRCTAVRLRGRLVTVVSLQNIRTELQQRELDAWQNLTKVLRHEIMNSITPIVSLSGTMRDIVETDLVPLGETEANGQVNISAATFSASISDLRDALATIEQRGAGIMKFVDAYRHFTTIPQPVLTDVAVDQLLRHVAQLMQPEARKSQVTVRVSSPELTIRADAGQIEMVLLNLLKNAIESLTRVSSPTVQLTALSSNSQIVIQVADNGPGIEPEAMEQIFIPFYTTKKTGSGIGLSLSRQIMQRHGGQLLAESTPGSGSVFQLIF
ncbi:sensor histidine kinase [Spirosoma sp. KUDC1026]|uniref:sensor histidine kinase n=1 Tax=Spirosoma sp. KUDC1026 TaxID=2745947 RepID=UPI00159BE861|nr:ATP-binding protein [Spirosoma sp. KUDC1026]QKZ12850.1 GHKL domain-containing protein [Spirosoma sp. KUDC1026]